jgi:hypothetical protein
MDQQAIFTASSQSPTLKKKKKKKKKKKIPAAISHPNFFPSTQFPVRVLPGQSSPPNSFKQPWTQAVSLQAFLLFFSILFSQLPYNNYNSYN